MDAEIREKTGRNAVIVAISGNVILTIFNFLVGTFSGSTALVAEAAHTLSDVLTSIVTAIGFKIGLKPPDSLHPYGHGRAEPLVGLVIVAFLVIIAYEILMEVYEKLFLGAPLSSPDLIAAVMALIGIVVNFTMTRYMTRIGKKINSPAIQADAQHQRVDIFSCAAIFIGVIGSRMGLPILDPLVAILISILVLRTAFEVGKDSVDTLMGTIPSPDILVQVKTAALKVNGIKGIHDLKINYMGPYASVDLHVEVDPELNLRTAHRIAHMVENEIIKEVDMVTIVNVHVCPEDEDDSCLDLPND